jgi:TPR repeat protein
MNAELPPPSQPEKAADGSFAADSRKLGGSLLAEAAKKAKILALSLKIVGLKRARLHATRMLGAKCHELDLYRERFAETFAAVDRLKAQITIPPREAAGPEKKSVSQMAKEAAARALLIAGSIIARLKLRPELVRLGETISGESAPELQSELVRLEHAKDAIIATETERAEIKSRDTGLGEDSKQAWESARAGAKQALNHGLEATGPIGTRIREKQIILSTRLQALLARTPLQRFSRRHLAIVSASALAVAITLFVYFQYWSFDETDPIAVADRADRLASHPGDPSKPENVSGVSDEGLMSPRKNARALDICIKAVEFSPDDPRRLFELGRVLLLAGEPDEAREFLNEAAMLGHVGAKAYLGRLEPDPEKALEIFQEAATEGFKPAAEMARQMEAFMEKLIADLGRESDERAGHPDDPTKPKNIKGVADPALESEDALTKAIDASAEAVAAFPEEPRYRFQLGRALMLAGMEDAIPHLEFATEKGHGAAMAYLARSKDDAFAAMDLLRRAEKAGFKPAKAMLQEIETQVGPDFEGQGYYFGDVFRALYDNYHPYLDGERWCNIQYAGFINQAFKKSVKALHDPGLDDVITPQLKDLKSHGRLATMSQEEAIFAVGLALSGAADPAGILEPQTQLQLEENALSRIEEDVAKLVSTYGENGVVTKRIAGGIRSLVRR